MTQEFRNEPTQDQIDTSMELGDQLALDTIETAQELAEEHDADDLGILYSLWCNLGRVLAEGGWTTKELSRDLDAHVRDQLGETLN